MRIPITNNLDTLPTTSFSYLASNVSAGGTALFLRNTTSFTNQYAQQIGKTGQEQTEIILGGVPSGTTVPLASGTLKFDHPLDTPVYQIVFDKVIIKRSTAGTAGTATALATASLTPDAPFTTYDDTSGAASYAYKVQYLNSLTNGTSSESDWIIPGGNSFYSLSRIRERVKNGLFSAEYIKSDDVVDEWINEWLEEMNTAAVKVNRDYLLGTVSVAFGTAGLGTITSEDFMYARKVEITYDAGINYVNSTFIPINQYAESDTFGGVAPRHSWQGDNVFRILPAGSGGTARITYSKGEPLLTDETDELPFPMRRYSRSFVYYGKHLAYQNDEKESLALAEYNKAQKVKNDFINEITPRDNTGPQVIDLVEGLGAFGEDDAIF